MLNGWKRRESCCCKGTKVLDPVALPLANVKTGRHFKVAGIKGGRNICARMASMGIYPGVEMELLCAGCGSPCLVRVHGGTLSLGSGVSDKILVTSLI